MDRAQSHHFYRYFEPADRFVRIRQVDPAQATSELSHELDAAGYRRAVMAVCVEDWEDALAGIETVPDELGEAEETLYGLAVDVNPELDIRAVRLPEAGASPRKRRSGQTAGDPRRRLRRVARSVEARLEERVIGQPHAVEAVAGAVRRAALGWNQRGPLCSMLFVGPTGVGKTELSRSLADELGDNKLIRVDCSEYAEGHEYAKLVGAPPGYVGHSEGGFLSAVGETPNSVVLFDEIEKAHSRLHHVLLQILDEGHLTDGRGQRIDFRQSFVLLTSNLGTRELSEAESSSIGFSPEETTSVARGEIVWQALTREFSPEFLGRLDEVLVFRNLSRREAVRITEGQLAELAARVRRDGPRVRFTSAVARWIVERGFHHQSGARGISHWIRREIEAPMAEELLADDRGRKGWLTVRIRGGRPRFERAA